MLLKNKKKNIFSLLNVSYIIWQCLTSKKYLIIHANFCSLKHSKSKHMFNVKKLYGLKINLGM